MTYTVQFTDSTNPSKPSITVADGALNNQTSLTFPGKNYSGYAPVVAGDFLHLLENFANSTAPANPVQGQLWFDTKNNSNVLMVYDGNSWVEAGNLKKAPYSSAPSVASSSAGDLWVDTTNSQLYLFSGSSWLLIGPQFSQGAATGPVVESIVDTGNLAHSVISLYALSSENNVSYRLAIISSDTFTPKSTITGYSSINEGINLYASTSSSTGSSAILWGTANSANALMVNNNAVAASNFLRSDVASTTNQALNVRSPNGISIGNDLSLSIIQNSNNFTFSSSKSANSIEFNVNKQILVHLDPNGKVGIGPGNVSPVSALSVAGVVTAGTPGTPGGLAVTDGGSPGSTTVFSVSPSAGIATSLNTTFTGSTVTIAGGQLILSAATADSSVILPPPTTGTPLYDIGSQSQPFRNVYAQNFVGAFVGNFAGSVTGSVTGTADALKTPTLFTVAGDVATPTTDPGVSFTGSQPLGTAVLNVAVQPQMIGGQKLASSSLNSDKILVLQNDTNLVKMTKATFLQGVAQYAIPVGSIMPYAGPASSVPPGWLLCDGSEVNRTTYNTLFNLFLYTYGAQKSLKGNNTFALPDLRGRFPLGLDNMNNYGNIPGFVQATTSGGTTVNTGGQIGAAGRITPLAANVLGNYGGNQSVVLDVTNIPQHTHNLQSANNVQYYAPGAEGATSDTSANANFGYGIPTGAGNTGYGISTTGNVNAPTVGQGVNTMNPYLFINYIIFTGSL